MIPRTYPSEYVTANGKTQMLVYVLTNITGLTRWIDYIPVKGVASENTVVENTYNYNGYMLMKTKDSITGLTPFKEYVPVYEDAAATVPWGTGSNGYIPAYGLFTVQGLFANGEQGWVYDPSNLSTLFQDAAGTTPVTAMEQPVGLQLDTRLGAPTTLGAELVTNGDFSTDTGWTLNTGWAISGGQLVATSVASGVSARNATSAVTGIWVKVTYTISITSGAVFLRVRNTAGTIRTTSGTFTEYLVVGSGTGFIDVVASGTFTGVLDNISVRELPGNHRYQTTSANRPVVSARVNLLTKTEDFSDSAWLKGSATGSANKITISALTNYVFEYATSFAQNTQYIGKVRIKNVDCGKIIIGFYEEGTGVFKGTLDVTSQVNTADYTEVSTTITTSASGVTALRFYVCSNSGTAIGQSYFVDKADLRPANIGVGLPAYQRVNTSADYATAGFPVYIKPNGSNQFMVTNSINFSATDKMTVWQGVRKLSDAARGMVSELSASVGSNIGAFAVTASDSAAANYGVYVAGTAINGRTYSTYAAPITNVLSASLTTAAANSSASQSLRFNGGASAGVEVNTGVSTGNFGNYAAYFYMRGGASLPFGGHDYGSICRGAASSAAQITAAEGWINQRTKAY